MSVSFKDKLFSEYTVPRELSIWEGSISAPPLEDLDLLIATCVDELGSDVQITSYLEATGMVTHMPENTITVTSAKLSSNFPFQGNRLVKATYDKSSNVCYLRYYPAVISYRRCLTVSDLDNLTGDRLIYVKSYIMWKMAERELSILHPANITIDNGQIDLSVLTSFRDTMRERYSKLKEEILLYSTIC